MRERSVVAFAPAVVVESGQIVALESRIAGDALVILQLTGGEVQVLARHSPSISWPA